VPRPLAIAFLACNKNPARYREDASFRYRCSNLATALGEQGHDTVCAHISRCPPRRFDIVVLHRPRRSLRLLWCLASWRRQGTRVVADVDDLIFLPELAALSPGVLNGVAAESEVHALFAAHGAALALMDHITVATAPLGHELRATFPGGPSVTVVPNAVALTWRGLPATDMAGPDRVVSYLPGTRSHDRDFAAVAPALTTLLRRHPLVKLAVTGPGRFELDVPAAQLLRHDKLPFEAYADHVRRARVNLLPLETTRFNHCKSALKVIEAGFWQVPTVCSPLPDALRFEGAGAHVAITEAEWLATLDRLLVDDAFHRAHSQGLRERVLALADVRAAARVWCEQVSAA